MDISKYISYVINKTFGNQKNILKKFTFFVQLNVQKNVQKNHSLCGGLLGTRLLFLAGKVRNILINANNQKDNRIQRIGFSEKWAGLQYFCIMETNFKREETESNMASAKRC